MKLTIESPSLKDLTEELMGRIVWNVSHGRIQGQLITRNSLNQEIIISWNAMQEIKKE